MVVATGIAVLLAGLSATTTWAGLGRASGPRLCLRCRPSSVTCTANSRTAIQAVKARGMAASWALVALSFLYGVFHAAGPGHGKIVISTYILTNESQLRRGLLLSISCSLCQGLTAIVAVDLTAGLLGFTLRQAQSAATDLETITYGLVALLGLTLILSRARRLYRRLGNSAPNFMDTCHNQDPNNIGTAHLAQVATMDMGPLASISTLRSRGRALSAWSHRLVYVRAVAPFLSCLSPILLTCGGLGWRCLGNVARHGDHGLIACDPLRLCAQGRIAACLS